MDLGARRRQRQKEVVKELANSSDALAFKPIAAYFNHS
jgi:hypothetical protein